MRSSEYICVNKCESAVMVYLCQSIQPKISLEIPLKINMLRDLLNSSVTWRKHMTKKPYQFYF